MSDVSGSPRQGSFPVIEVDSIPTRIVTRRSVASHVIGLVEERGIDSNTVIFTGFEGMHIIADLSFGDRDSTWGVSRTQFQEAHDGYHWGWERFTPLSHVINRQRVVPAIGVFDVNELVGGRGNEEPDLMVAVTPEELQANHGLIFWATQDGASLDKAARAVIVLPDLNLD